jgi:hypothetical protein
LRTFWDFVKEICHSDSFQLLVLGLILGLTFMIGWFTCLVVVWSTFRIFMSAWYPLTAPHVWGIDDPYTVELVRVILMEIISNEL